MPGAALDSLCCCARCPVQGVSQGEHWHRMWAPVREGLEAIAVELVHAGVSDARCGLPASPALWAGLQPQRVQAGLDAACGDIRAFRSPCRARCCTARSGWRCLPTLLERVPACWPS